MQPNPVSILDWLSLEDEAAAGRLSGVRKSKERKGNVDRKRGSGKIC